MSLPDVQQSTKGFYKSSIDKVGVRNIKVPFTVKKRDNSLFNTVAKCSSYCDLVANVKGINMSRISRTINNILSRDKYGFDNLKDFVTELQQSHGTNEAWIKAEFTYFLNEFSPIEKLQCLEPVEVTFESHLRNNVYKDYLRVKTKQMSLCPCSKEMSLLMNNLTLDELNELNNSNFSDSLMEKIKLSGFGAHNQKSEIDILVEVNYNNRIWIEELIDISRNAASCYTYSTLKRADEKYVTEASYMGKYIDENGKLHDTNNNDGAKFVEDIARDCAKLLDTYIDKQIYDYVIVVNNEESIHSDDIYATAIKTAGRFLS